MAMIKYDENNVPYVDIGKNYRLCLEKSEYNDQQSKQKAETELRETPEIVESAIKEFKILLQGNILLYALQYNLQKLEIVE